MVKRDSFSVRSYWRALEETKEFVKLRDKWYNKLQEEGFHDSELHGESYVGYGTKMAGDHNHKLATVHDREEYYNAAKETYWHLERTNGWQDVYSSPNLSEVWYMHCMGVSPAETGKLLGLQTDTVVKYCYIVRKYMKKMRKDEQEAKEDGTCAADNQHGKHISTQSGCGDGCDPQCGECPGSQSDDTGHGNTPIAKEGS